MEEEVQHLEEMAKGEMAVCGGDGLWGDDGLGDEGGGGGCCDARLLRVVAVSTWRVGKEEN